ncbi:MAG: porin, partial [Pseudomonadales bacterium]|nr:porin [Pseudomonadales bacterium]
IGAAIAMPGVAMAESQGPKVYGKMNVTYEFSDYDYSLGPVSESADTWELNSNASRLGVKGSEEITDDLSAIYQAEYGIYVDDGGSGGQKEFTQRDIFVGLKGGWGTVKLGKFDTPLKKSQGKIDQFNDMSLGDIGNVLVGENREADLIQYSSPKIADAVTLNVAIQPGEEYCPTGSANTCQDGAAENFSASAVFSSDMIYAAVGIDDGIDGFDVVRLTGIVNLDAFEVGLLYQTAEVSEGTNPDEEDGYILSAGMKLGSANKIRFQYGFSEYDEFLTDTVTGTTEVTQFGLGFDHKLSKQTKLFANYIMAEVEYSETNVAITEDYEETRIQFGLEHKF